MFQNMQILCTFSTTLRTFVGIEQNFIYFPHGCGYDVSSFLYVLKSSIEQCVHASYVQFFFIVLMRNICFSMSRLVFTQQNGF